MNGHARHWIDGAWLDSARRGQSFDPASGQPIGTYADGGRAEADAAIAAAVRAFEDGRPAVRTPAWHGRRKI